MKSITVKLEYEIISGLSQKLDSHGSESGTDCHQEMPMETADCLEDLSAKPRSCRVIATRRISNLIIFAFNPLWHSRGATCFESLDWDSK